jgi:predicted RND superfamily exporter protein
MAKWGVTLERFAEFIIQKRKMLMVLFGILTLVSVALIPGVRINYNLSSYLPKDMGTKRAMEVMKQEFSLSGMARVMVEDISIAEIADLKTRMAQVDGVRSVVALNDVIDPQMPVEFYDEKVVEDSIRWKAYFRWSLQRMITASTPGRH